MSDKETQAYIRNPNDQSLNCRPVKNKLYNSLTKDGKKIVELAIEIGV